MILIMTVEPGFGGQGFIDECLPKIKELKAILNEKGLNVPIQVDGGINDITSSLSSKAGADIMVAGSYLFKAENMEQAVESLRK